MRNRVTAMAVLLSMLLVFGVSPSRVYAAEEAAAVPESLSVGNNSVNPCLDVMDRGYCVILQSVHPAMRQHGKFMTPIRIHSAGRRSR